MGLFLQRLSFSTHRALSHRFFFFIITFFDSVGSITKENFLFIPILGKFRIGSILTRSIYCTLCVAYESGNVQH